MNQNIATYLKNLVQIVCSPARGWEDLAREENAEYHKDTSVARPAWDENRAAVMFRHCFLPWTGLCSATVLVRLAYGLDAVAVVQRMLTVFVALFLAAQVGRWALAAYGSHLVTEGSVPRNGRWLQMVLFALGFVALVAAVENVVRVRIALVEFMPLYAVFILWKGWRYGGIAEKNVGIFVGLASVAVLGTVYMVEFLLGAVI